MNEEDFPLYEKKPGTIYFDSSCVSMKPRSVLASMNEYYEEYPACAGRSNHTLGTQVTERVEEARKNIQNFLGGKKGTIIFTRNTTEGINLVANTFRETTVLTSDKEHNSNHVPWLHRKGITRIELPTTNGKIDLAEYEELLNKHDIDLVSINHMSNLDGITNPVEELTKLAHKAGAKILLDAAQSTGHTPINLKKLGVDYFAASGHKMLGPSGTGILYVHKESIEELEPTNVGGDTVNNTWTNKYELSEPPHRFEGGLQNYAGMIGLGTATKYLEKTGVKKIETHCSKLQAQLNKGIQELPITFTNKEETPGAITTITPKNLEAHHLNLLLNKKNILTRSGTFCVHSYFNKHNLPAAIRFSSHLYNNEEEVQTIIEFLNGPAKNLL